MRKLVLLAIAGAVGLTVEAGAQQPPTGSAAAKVAPHPAARQSAAPSTQGAAAAPGSAAVSSATAGAAPSGSQASTSAAVPAPAAARNTVAGEGRRLPAGAGGDAAPDRAAARPAAAAVPSPSVRDSAPAAAAATNLGPGSTIGAVAPPSSDLQNSQIDIAYVAPSDPKFRPIYDRLKQRQPLEELRQFLAPLRLPRKLLVRTAQCGSVTADYQPNGPATICYEYLDQLGQLAPKDRTPDGVARADVITGAFVQAMLYQTARAVFDILQVPVWGREADAADELAGYLMLQFGKDVALRTLNGTAWFFAASDHTWTGSDFSDERGTEAQRFYNYLCIAYGGDPITFASFVQKKTLPDERALRCAHEFSELRFAFGKTIAPYVDQDLLKIVLATQWLRPDDGK